MNIKKLDIDSGCSPVAYLRFFYTNNIIGNRSFGSDVENSDYALLQLKELNKAEGIAIIKHIPGHG